VDDDGKIWRIFRDDEGGTYSWKMGQWINAPDYWLRVQEDTAFVEIDKSEANELIQTVGMAN
jgi:hypothetical protein